MKKLMMVGVCAALGLATAARAQWTTQAYTNDAQLPVGGGRVYTHAFNVGSGDGNVSINGVTFQGAGLTGTHSTYGGSFKLTGAATATSHTPSGTSGNINTLLNNFYYNGAPAALMLYGLQVGSNYVVRFYVQDDYGGGLQVFVANDNVADTAQIARDGGKAPGAVISRTITAQAGGVVAVSVVPVTAGTTFHFYGFSVEQAATPASRTNLITNLFNTGVNANGVVLAATSADPHYTLTGPTLPSTKPQAMVMTPHANWTPASFTGWIGASSSAGGVANGTYTYTTTFTIGEDDDPRTAVIAGRAFADDTSVKIYLNGVKAVDSGFSWAAAEPGTAFRIVHGQSGASFQKGVNTLRFDVSEQAGGGVQGLRVCGMKGTVETAIPGLLMLLK